MVGIYVPNYDNVLSESVNWLLSRSPFQHMDRKIEPLKSETTFSSLWIIDFHKQQQTPF